VHILTLFGRDTVGTSVTVFLLEDSLHVETPGMAGLVRVGDKVSNPAKCYRSIPTIPGFVREHLTAKLQSLGDV